MVGMAMAGGTARGGGSIRSDGGGDGNSGRMSKWVSVAGVLITWSAVLNAWNNLCERRTRTSDPSDT